MRLLSIDPGKASGWFCWDSQSTGWIGGEMQHDQILDWCDPELNDSSPLVLWHLERVLIEDFKIGPKSYQTSPHSGFLWSVKQIGAFEMWCRRLGIAFETQMPLAKKFVENHAKLKKIGWYNPMPGVTGEEGHRRMAANHALKWGLDHGLLEGGELL